MHSSQIQKDLSIWKGNKQFTEQILISPFLNFVSWLFFQSSNSFYFIHPGNDGQTSKAWPWMLASTNSLILLAAAQPRWPLWGWPLWDLLPWILNRIVQPHWTTRITSKNTDLWDKIWQVAFNGSTTLYLLLLCEFIMQIKLERNRSWMKFCG